MKLVTNQCILKNYIENEIFIIENEKYKNDSLKIISLITIINCFLVLFFIIGENL